MVDAFEALVGGRVRLHLKTEASMILVGCRDYQLFIFTRLDYLNVVLVLVGFIWECWDAGTS